MQTSLWKNEPNLEKFVSNFDTSPKSPQPPVPLSPTQKIPAISTQSAYIHNAPYHPAQRQQQNQPVQLSNNHHGQMKLKQNMIQLGRKKDQADSTTSSDTLIDADSSFADSIAKLDHMLRGQQAANYVKPIPIYPQVPHPPPPSHLSHVQNAYNSHLPGVMSHPTVNYHMTPTFTSGAQVNQVKSPQKTQKNTRYLSQLDQYDDEDEEKIVINMDELSLTSLVSLEHETTDDSIQVFNNNNNTNSNNNKPLAVATEINNHMTSKPMNVVEPHQNLNTSTGTNQQVHHFYHHHHLHGSQLQANRMTPEAFQQYIHAEDEEFEKDLKTLDEKILRVKQMLESMKPIVGNVTNCAATTTSA